MAIRWCISHGIKTLVIGDLKGIANGTKVRLDHKSRQKIGQWEYYQQTQYLLYRAKERGISVVFVGERYTSQTCPRCGHRHKAKGRVFSCRCGLTMHRDIVGAYNILMKHVEGFLIANDLFRPPIVKYRRIDYKSRSCWRQPAGRNSPL